MESSELISKMRLLTHIVAEHQMRRFVTNSQKIDETCSYLRIDEEDALRLVEQLCNEGYVSKDNETKFLYQRAREQLKQQGTHE